MISKFIILILFMFSIGGCSSLSPRDKANPDDVLDRIKSAAVLGYLYAQIAENTYTPHDTYILPPELSNPINMENDNYGFAYSVFYRHEGGNLVEVILSFRGTDQFRDWPIGNILALQNNRGLAVYKELRRSTPAEVPITLVGHSLGGAIALHISLREAGVRTFVFNTSTRYTRGRAVSSERHSYSEYAEANKILRTFSIDPKWTHSIYSCTFGNPLKNHAQVSLAACLTACAAQDLEDARVSVERNMAIFEGSMIIENACK